MNRCSTPVTPAARFLKMIIRVRPLMSLFIVALSLHAASPLPAQDSTRITGIVTPTDYSPSAVAVMPFELAGTEAIKGQDLSEIIQRDLALSGFFKGPTNPQFAKETHAFDLKENKIHYADWHRMGVSYVVKGKYQIKGNELEMEFRTYDTAAASYIFGKRYIKYSKANARQMAHRGSNDIIQRITGEPGFAHTQILCVGELGGKKAGTVSVKEIFVMDADGEARRQLTQDRNLAATPAWGARGTEVYYTTYKDYNPDLAGIYLDGTYNWFVSRRAGFNLSPAWSEKRGLIALTLSKDGNSEVYTMTRAGKDLKRLTYGKNIDSSPAWSPDGRQIAFTSDRTGQPQIYIMDDSGVNVRQLTRSGSYNDGASWSPKGDTIAFSSRIGSIFQIFTINVNGQDLRQLTSGDYNNEDPSWSPNGWVLLYTSEQTGKKQLCTMFIDGRKLAQITDGPASYSSSWSPLFP